MCDIDSDRHDDLLYNMLKECKTLPTFLNHIFGFLHRRTDFYFKAKDSNSSVGLPDGLAEELVKHTFYKWKPKAKDEVFEECDIPAVISEEVIISSEGEVANCVDNSDINNVDSKQNIPQGNFSNSERYNGSSFENYCWSQTIGEVDVSVKVPDDVTSKALTVTILPNRLSILVNNQPLLEGELRQKCKHNDAIWSLDKRKLQIHLDKCQEMWWDCLVTSEDKLDLTKIDCTRPYEDLSEETQAKIAELEWNQHRKRLGLPTSDEVAKEELLRKAWNAEGSPFNTPFDPNSVTFYS